MLDSLSPTTGLEGKWIGSHVSWTDGQDHWIQTHTLTDIKCIQLLRDLGATVFEPRLLDSFFDGRRGRLMKAQTVSSDAWDLGATEIC